MPATLARGAVAEPRWPRRRRTGVKTLKLLVPVLVASTLALAACTSGGGGSNDSAAGGSAGGAEGAPAPALAPQDNLGSRAFDSAGDAPAGGGRSDSKSGGGGGVRTAAIIST